MTEIRQPSRARAETPYARGRGSRLFFEFGTPYHWQGTPGWDPESLGRLGPDMERRRQQNRESYARSAPEVMLARVERQRERRAAMTPEERERVNAATRARRREKVA